LAEFAIVGLGRRKINFYGRGLAMTLKVIGAGFGRTGTWSTKAALNELGLPCYHMSEIILNKENKSHLNFWRKVANSPPGATQDWQQVFAKYQATVDNPGCCVWRELLAAYPGAKVLLTLHPRGAEAWYESTIDTIYFTENMWQFKVLEWLTPFGRKFGDMSRKLIWERSLQGTMSDKAKPVTTPTPTKSKRPFPPRNSWCSKSTRAGRRCARFWASLSRRPSSRT
jgi:hypothetical protein